LRPSSLALAFLIAFNPKAFAAEKVDPSPVVAAERAFAADGQALGIKGSFLKHAASDGFVFAPDPVNARDFYGARDDRATPPLVWWPVYAGIARSGDLGFTTGPATLGGKHSGWYFTVWKKQPDGSWQWSYDGGPPSNDEFAPAASEPVRYLPLAPKDGPAPDEAFAAVQVADAAIARAAAQDLSAALRPHLSADAVVVGQKRKAGFDAAAVAAELAARPQKVVFAPEGGEAAGSGDFAWTWGRAGWTGGAGHYVRIWQLRGGKWALVYDLLLPKA
jgi:hypothetical protein